MPSKHLSRRADIDGNITTELDISVDIIYGTIPFLIGLPTLEVMHSSINSHNRNLFFTLRGLYHRLQLFKGNSHLHLPFNCNDVVPKNTKDQAKNEPLKQGRHYNNDYTRNECTPIKSISHCFTLSHTHAVRLTFPFPIIEPLFLFLEAYLHYN